MALTSGQPLTTLGRLAPAHMNRHLFEQSLEQLVSHPFDGIVVGLVTQQLLAAAFGLLAGLILQQLVVAEQRLYVKLIARRLPVAADPHRNGDLFQLVHILAPLPLTALDNGGEEQEV